MHIFRPADAVDAAPTLVHLACGASTLESIGFNSTDAGLLRYGGSRYATNVIGLTTPSSRCWEFGADGVANSSRPQPCDSSRDIAYVQTALSYMAANAGIFDLTRTFVEGGVGLDSRPFNDTSLDVAFAGFAGVCLSASIHGYFQARSGLALTGQAPTMPRREAACSASSWAAHGYECVGTAPCTGCEFWPAWPCWSGLRPLTVCSAVGQLDPLRSTALYMHDAAAAEGHHAQVARAPP